MPAALMSPHANTAASVLQGAARSPVVLPSDDAYFEVRFESIGGLGAHAAGQVLATASVVRMGLNGAHFSSYGSEKKGSLIRSYVRLGAGDRPDPHQRADRAPGRDRRVPCRAAAQPGDLRGPEGRRHPDLQRARRASSRNNSPRCPRPPASSAWTPRASR